MVKKQLKDSFEQNILDVIREHKKTAMISKGIETDEDIMSYKFIK